MQTAEFKTGYLDDALDNLAGVVERGRQVLADIEFDTLVGTGLSGAVVVPSLALALGKPFVIVRKPNDGSHHNGTMIGNLGAKWVFVDDFVSSGATRRRVKDAIAVEAAKRDHITEYIGDYCYARWEHPDETRGIFYPHTEEVY